MFSMCVLLARYAVEWIASSVTDPQHYTELQPIFREKKDQQKVNATFNDLLNKKAMSKMSNKGKKPDSGGGRGGGGRGRGRGRGRGKK
jgi:hypothetical protein